MAALGPLRPPMTAHGCVVRLVANQWLPLAVRGWLLLRVLDAYGHTLLVAATWRPWQVIVLPESANHARRTIVGHHGRRLATLLGNLTSRANDLQP